MITPEIKDFLDKYSAFLKTKTSPETVGKIHVDEIASKIATFYERLRNIVDYREEHLLRKGTIGRIFKRQILLWKNRPDFAEFMIKEIIRAGHLPNDTIPETKIKEVQKIIEKYIFLIDKLEVSREPDRHKIVSWLIRIGACELEEKLDPPVKDMLLSELMLKILNERLILQNGQISDKEKYLQLFINIQRALLRVDDDQLNYRLLKFIYPNWTNLSLEDSTTITTTLSSIKKELESLIRYPLGPIFLKLCNRYNTTFYLIGDIAFGKQKTEEKNDFEDLEQFKKAIKVAYQKRYGKEKSKIKRLAFFSVLSFFLSKIAIAVAIEMPLDLYVVQHFSWLNIGISIISPPLLMLIIISSIKMPSEKNLELVVDEAAAVVFLDKTKKYSLQIPTKKSWPTEVAVNLFYLLMFVVSFGLICWGLLELNFSIASIIIFLFFTSLVAVTGVKAYNRSRELSLEEEKSTFFSFIIDLFAMPLVTVGKWANYGLSKFNIISTALDLVVEVPFQMFVGFLENFRGFIKSKKEEIY